MRWQRAAKWGLLVLALLAGSAWADQQLVGHWSLNGQPYMVLDKNGRGTLQGASFKWHVQGSNLVLQAANATNVLPYQFKGSVLWLQILGVPIELRRMQGNPSANAPPKSPGGNAGSGSDQLSKLLMSSAWCSFSYNQATGSSSTARFRFFNNGSYSNSARAESYNSGRYGSVAGQGDSGGTGRWVVRNGQLYLSAPPQQPELQQVPVSVTRNSSGYPILKADGVEYSMCR